MNNYENFLESKLVKSDEAGIQIDQKDLNTNLFGFQKHIVLKALSSGRYAIFADCGLGKTIMQLEWARHVVKATDNPCLIITPLAVSGQTIAEGHKFGIKVHRWRSGITDPGIYITNYEQLNNIDTSIFSGVVLDESSILKNFEGKLRNKIIEAFQSTPYKLACTATPSPNDHMEMGNHAEFLGRMTRSEMLAMYFVHDGGETSKWRLKGHAERRFWEYISTWATAIAKPSDIGFSDEGYNLPGLRFKTHEIRTPKRNNGMLFNSMAVSATDFNKELRATMEERLNKVCDICNDAGDNQVIIWVRQNAEGERLRKMIPGAVELTGSDSTETKEEKIYQFQQGEINILITKQKIAQFGVNLQNCHIQIFASLDFSFESLYQAIRRSYRFGQDREVTIHMITTDTMQNVIQSIERKEEQFQKMQKNMTEKVSFASKKRIAPDQQATVETGQNFTAWHGDCVEVVREIMPSSIDFSVFSPPFADLYTYSDDHRDMGNSSNWEEFVYHFGFLVRELSRIIKPGRLVSVHCMDLPIQKGKEGVIALRDFSGIILQVFADAGFLYHSRVTIWKDPVVEMQRTKALGLLHKQIKKDSAMSRVGIPDYVLTFRNAGDNEVPITHQDRDPSKPGYMPVDKWQRYASPVWMDIDYGKTMNGYREGRAERDEKHICPLQLPTIKRLIDLYSNEEELILSPFMGIGSEGFQAIKMNRRFVGVELKKSYFDIAVKNLAAANQEKSQLTIFDEMK